MPTTKHTRRAFLRNAGIAGLGMSGGIALTRPEAKPANAGEAAYPREDRVKITDPPYNAVGDGRDESRKIEWALDDHMIVEIPPAPEGPGYGVSLESPIRVKSNRTLIGTGGQLIRVGRFEDGGKIFTNEDGDRGNNNILFRNLIVKGRRDEIPNLPERANCVLFYVVAQNDSACANIGVIGNLILDWPGTVHRGHNLNGFSWLSNEIRNAHRGGLIGGFFCRDGRVTGNIVTSGGDDAIAINSSAGQAASGNASRDIVIENNPRLEVQRRDIGGNAIAIRGGNQIYIRRNKTFGGVRAGIAAFEDEGALAREIHILDNEITDPDGHAVEMFDVRSGSLSGNSARQVGERPAYFVHGDRDGVTVGNNQGG